MSEQSENMNTAQKQAFGRHLQEPWPQELVIPGGHDSLSPLSRRDTPTAGPASAGWLGADVEADGHAGAPHPARHLAGRPGLGAPEGGGGGLWAEV